MSSPKQRGQPASATPEAEACSHALRPPWRGRKEETCARLFVGRANVFFETALWMMVYGEESYAKVSEELK